MAAVESPDKVQSQGVFIKLTPAQLRQVAKEHGLDGAVVHDSLSLPPMLRTEVPLSAELWEAHYKRDIEDERLSVTFLRSILVYSCIRRAVQPIGVTDIAKQVGLGKGTVYRYLTTLLAMQMIHRDPTSRKYSAGTMRVARTIRTTDA